MTAPPGLRLSDPAAVSLALWSRFDASRVAPLYWVIGAWLLLVTPMILLRGAHFEDGTTIAIARGAIVDGHWLNPHIYGVRFIERPTLLAWLIAAINWPLGRVDAMLARIPTVLALLAGGIMIFRLVRRYASLAAALFAVACFFVSPMVLQRLVTAEADMLLSVLLFGAFVVWWDGYERGGSSFPRWALIGLIVTAAGFAKGIQPCAYFFLGVGAFLLIRRRWREIAGLALAGVIAFTLTTAWYVAVYMPGDIAVWHDHARLAEKTTWAFYASEAARFALQMLFASLPALILIGVLVLDARLRAPGDPQRPLTQALLLYAGCCTFVLLFWPGTLARYGLPALPALAAAAGILFDEARKTRQRLVGTAVMMAAGLGLYQIIVGWIALPLAPNLRGSTRAATILITQTIGQQPAPLYASYEDLPKNALAFVPDPIRALPSSQLVNIPLPAWVLLTRTELEKVTSARPAWRVSPPVSFEAPIDRVLVHISN